MSTESPSPRPETASLAALATLLSARIQGFFRGRSGQAVHPPTSSAQGALPPPLPPGPRTALLLGDSLPPELPARLRLPGVTLHVHPLPPPPDLRPAPGQERAQFVFLIYTAGDLLHTHGDPARLLAQARAVVESLAERHPAAEVILSSVPPSREQHGRLNARILDLDRGLLALAEERGLPWIDLHGMLRDDLAPRPAIDPRYSRDGLHLSDSACRRFRDAIASEVGQRTPRLVGDAARDAAALIGDALLRTRETALDHARHRGLYERGLDPARDRVALLFFGDVERDRWVRGDHAPRRFARQVLHALTHRQRTSGFGVAFAALCKALSRSGFRVVVNDAALARANPHYPVGVAGYPHILERWSLPNPAILGPGLFDHPGQAPSLPDDPRFRSYLVPEGWMTDLFTRAWDGFCKPWHAGVDLATWPGFRAAPKDIDVLVFVKFLWDRPGGARRVLEPLLAALARRGKRVHVLRYGAYEPGEYRTLLRRSRAMAYLCEHETQGIATAEAMACDVPILAWDQGEWKDPIRLVYSQDRVPASSVPYFDATCGDRFRGPEDMDLALDRFFEALPRYRPRDFARRRLSFESSAALYEEAFRHAAGLPRDAPPASQPPLGGLRHGSRSSLEIA